MSRLRYLIDEAPNILGRSSDDGVLSDTNSSGKSATLFVGCFLYHRDQWHDKLMFQRYPVMNINVNSRVGEALEVSVPPQVPAQSDTDRGT